METAALLTSTFTFGMASLARDLINTFDLHEMTWPTTLPRLEHPLINLLLNS